jgi:hypothetical protein
MQKYLAKTQPDIVQKLEDEKRVMDIENLKLSTQLSLNREKQEKL